VKVALCLICVPFCALVAASLDLALGLGLASVVVAALAWESLAAWVVRRGLGGRWMNVAGVVVQTGVPTAVIAIDACHAGASFALTDAPPLLYVPALLLAALRFDARHALLAAVLASSQYLVATAALRWLLPADYLDPVTPEVAAAIALKVLALLGCALLGEWVVGNLRGLARDQAGAEAVHS
jgi:hypothetical protein